MSPGARMPAVWVSEPLVARSEERRLAKERLAAARVPPLIVKIWRAPDWAPEMVPPTSSLPEPPRVKVVVPLPVVSAPRDMLPVVARVPPLRV